MLVEVHRFSADAWSWEYFLRETAQPGWLNELVDPELASWMDEGILSRWLLDGFPTIEALLAEVSPLLEAYAGAELRATLHAIGVLDGRAAAAHPSGRSAPKS